MHRARLAANEKSKRSPFGGQNVAIWQKNVSGRGVATSFARWPVSTWKRVLPCRKPLPAPTQRLRAPPPVADTEVGRRFPTMARGACFGLGLGARNKKGSTVKKEKRKKEGCNTRTSQEVTHPSTCLLYTSPSPRD